MKKLFIIMMLNCFCLISLTAALLKNGDFEITKNGKPKFWRVHGLELNCVKTDFPRGEASIVFKKSGSIKTQNIVQTLEQPLKAGCTYRVSFFAKGEKFGQQLTVFFFSGKTKEVKHCNRWKRFQLTKNWKKYIFEHTFATGQGWQERKFSFGFYGEKYGSTTWIDDVEISEVIGKAANKAADKNDELIKFKSGSRKNMVINPGFEFEWQGWMVYGLRDVTRSYNDTVAERITFSSEKAHSGKCLIIPPNNSIQSIKYPLDQKATYTLSFYARKGKAIPGGQNSVSVGVKTPMFRSVRMEIGKKLTSQWKRFCLKIPGRKLHKNIKSGQPYPEFLANSFCIFAATKDTECFFDSFQLEKGPMTKYDPGYQVGVKPEVADGLYVKGIKKNLTIIATSPKGFSEELTLKAQAADIYGAVLWRKKFDIPKSTQKILKWEVTLDNALLGVVNVQVDLLKKSSPGKPIAICTGRYVVIDSLKPLRPNHLMAGLSWEEVISPMWQTAERLRIASDVLGMSATKLHPLEPRNAPKGYIYDEKAQSKRIPMLMKKAALYKKYNWGLCVSFHPYMGWPFYPHSYRPLSPEEKEKAYNKFADKLIAHSKLFNGTFDHILALGEPNNYSVKNGPDKGKKIFPPDEYARFLISMYKHFEKKGVKIPLAASMSGYAVDDYLKAICKSGAYKYLDTLNAHYYRSTPETGRGLYEDIARHKALMKKYNAKMKIINTETYYGLLSMYTTTYGEYNGPSFSILEDDQAGRTLQAVLHQAAHDVPFYIFNLNSSIFRIGVTNPVFYYMGFGGYRFLSQKLVDLKQAENVDINKKIRCFIFEKQNGEKFVSINTKLYETKGTMTVPQSCKAYDVNGNPLSKKEIPVSYLPGYFIFPVAVSVESIKKELQEVAFTGLEFPVEVTFGVKYPSQKLTLKAGNNQKNPVSFKLSFKDKPQWASKIKDVSMKLKGKEQKELDLLTISEPLVWNKDYKLNYSLESADSIISSSFKIPGLFIKKSAAEVVIDGEMSDWNKEDLMFMDKKCLRKGYEKVHGGNDDFSASLGVKWDDQNFYVLVVVTDNKISHGKGFLNALHQNDSLQIYFDEKNNAKDSSIGYDYDDVVYSIGMDKYGKPVAFLDKNPSGRFVGEGNALSGIDKDVEIGYKKLKNGYIFELKFPRRTLPFIDFKEGTAFGFSMFIHDSDGKGRKQSMILGDTKVSPYLHPQTWKKVKLIK